MWQSLLYSVSFKCALVSNLVFYTLSLLCFYVDSLASSSSSSNNETFLSSWAKRNKLQPNIHLSRDERKELILLSSFNMTIIAIFVWTPLSEWLWNYIQDDERRLTEEDEWIWYIELCYKLPIHALIAEIGFYTIHMLLHSSSFLYKHIHKVHHRFVAPTAMGCVYTHPIECLIGNFLPVYLGPMLTNAHPLTCYFFWFPSAILGTCMGHSGYCFMGYIDPHDAHHLHFQFNYGGMFLLDYIFGTSAGHPAGKRI
uniref:Fatty acid hydroxylase domain-containing protein n=1 Tax=Ditylum brightwellii TaxID=49249 RepID=A0A6U3QVN8_9STRA|mmetsp:Transcript_23905/g.35660  ORF Transcript_23905/g.35660 Transcript_23905/m.35660 type:complete len:255 (-) Transcript_23905:567-1331(-)